ncbi:MAG: TRAP transporter small permease subunit [Rhizobiaceae bacterium]|nr:TRAP transporter small permease subunit [Rhizobiaceae bacterium]
MTGEPLDSAGSPAKPALVVRTFGWLMLTVLGAFLIANFLNVGYKIPTALSGNPMMLLLYAVAIALGLYYVMGSKQKPLREDALLIHNFNVYLVRACFWAVLFVGVADMTIAFLRTENLAGYFMSEDLVKQLVRPQFVGTYVHVPLIVAGFIVAAFTRTLGFMWLALLIVVAELLIVLSRFIFSYEQAFMADLVRYWYAALFLFSSAYTLFEEGHVRVDVFYAGFKEKTRGYINAIGTLLLGITTCWVIIYIGFDGKTSIINSPVSNFEVTQTGSVGMFVKYQMAAFLGVFAITMLIQFVSYLFEAMADYREEAGKRQASPISH